MQKQKEKKKLTATNKQTQRERERAVVMREGRWRNASNDPPWINNSTSIYSHSYNIN